jgi:lipopolysaccharide/colanic/teichoic acid biosynthesis glycosyltransferase
MVKRSLDIVVSAVALILLSPLFLVVAVLVKLSSPGPVFFSQQRMGRNFRPFYIHKFRSMTADAPLRGGPITFGDDPRITRMGRILRKTKLDEMPQLFNVLMGEMSFVGPRPEAIRYVEMFRDDYASILRVRPGITDLASLKYHDEATLLGRAANPEEEYVQRVLPEKIALAKEYVARSSFLLDLTIIVKTVLTVAGDRVKSLAEDCHNQPH